MENKQINLYDDFGEKIGTYNPKIAGSLQDLYESVDKARKDNKISVTRYLAYQAILETNGLELSAEERIEQKVTLEILLLNLAEESEINKKLNRDLSK